MSLGENIEALRAAFDHSYADIGKAVNTDAQQIHYLVQNNSVRSKYAPQIAKFYNVDLATLLTGDTNEVLLSARRDRPTLESRRPQGAAIKMSRVPVIGEARLGDSGFFVETPYEAGVEGHVLYNGGGSDAFALKCKGDSMRPAIEPGDFVVVDPRQRVSFGDLVMCQTTDGRRMIKKLGIKRDGMTELNSLNRQFETITLDEDEIAQLYFADGPIKASYHQETID